MTEPKLMPMAREQEQAAIGTMLVIKETVPVLLTNLCEEDFTTPLTKAAYKAIHSLYEHSSEFSPVDVLTRMQEHGYEASFSQLTNLMGHSVSSVQKTINALHDRRLRRGLIAGLQQLLPKIYDLSVPVGEQLATLQRLQTDAVTQAQIPGLTPSQILQRDEQREQLPHLQLGIPFFDTEFYADCGSHSGQTEVIYGYTKHGKTFYALWKTAQYLMQGYRGLYATMEDSDSGVTHRLLGTLQNHDVADNLHIADKASGVRNLDDIINFIRYWKAKDDIHFVVVDYLQRIPVTGISYFDETPRIQTASNLLTDVAQEERIFMMLLAQPRGMPKGRSGWDLLPQPDETHGSSNIEKDAFAATAVFRPSRIPNLCKTGYNGELVGVRGPNDELVDPNSVYIKQTMTRYGQVTYAPFRFVHTSSGLVIPEHDEHVMPASTPHLNGKQDYRQKDDHPF